jgi:hypothetical protein
MLSPAMHGTDIKINLSGKFKFRINLIKTAVCHKDCWKFFINSRLTILIVGNVLEKVCKGNQNTFCEQKRIFEKLCSLESYEQINVESCRVWFVAEEIVYQRPNIT